ncbi:hypothetical protein WJX79_001994 [Trebouxia sp. C0005]
MSSEPKRVLITGAAGQIGYALCPQVARGGMLGHNQPIILHLLDIAPAQQSLEGVKMELVDAAFPLLKGIVISTDPVEACKDVDVAVMVGGFPRKGGMERKDVMAKNVAIYKSQAAALEKGAKPDVKVVVVANPANTNALILKENAPKIPNENVTCLTRLDHNRALGQVAEKAKGKPIREVIGDDEYLNNEFIQVVQQRGAAIIKARNLSSAMSAASSACDHIYNWINGTPKDTWVSMGVYSDGSYNAPKDIIFSFPVKCKAGKWEIVQGLPIDEFSKAKLKATGDELVEEKPLCSLLQHALQKEVAGQL